MTLSFANLVISIKESVAFSGSSGVSYVEVVNKLSVPPKAAFVIAQRFVEGEGFSFRVGEQPVALALFSFDQFEADLGQLRCYASSVEVDRACAVVDPGVIQEEEGYLRSVLEKVTASGPRGCLISEVARAEAGSQTHASVDKLVGLGYLVKQCINPTARGAHCRCDSKAVVLHNKVNAPYYDEDADGVKLIIGNSYLEKIHNLIVDILDRRNVHSLPARDLARCLGMSRWDMQALRNATIALDKKEGAKVKFFQMMCNFQHENGTLSTDTLMWCAARAEDQVFLDAAAGDLTFVSPRNLPVHETIATALNEGERDRTGITAADIRALTGASYKRAAKVFTEFHKVLGFPLEKVQEGKQLRHKIFPKQPRAVPVPMACAAVVPLVPASADAAVAPPTAAPLLSDQQQLNCEVILEYLRQNQGIASVMDIVVEVRNQSKRRQQQLLLAHPSGIVLPPSSNAMDRRTIDRTLHLLEYTMQRVTTRLLDEHVAPGGSPTAQDGNAAVVILRDTGQSEVDMVTAYIARQQALEVGSKPGAESAAESLKRPGAPVSVKKRKRRVQDSSSEDDEEEFSVAMKAADKPHHARDDTSDSDFSAGKEEPSKKARGRSALDAPEGSSLYRRAVRARALGQKKSNDDPALFGWQDSLGDALPALPLAQPAGELVAAMCLHAHLLRAISLPGDTALGEDLSAPVGTSLTHVINSLPFEFFYTSSAALHSALSSMQEQSPENLALMQMEVRELLTAKASTQQVVSTASEALAGLVTGCRGDFEKQAASLVCLLASVGAVRVGDAETRAALATLLNSEEERGRVSLVAVLLEDASGKARAALSEQAEAVIPMRAFAEMYLLLTRSVALRVSAVVDFLCGQMVAVELLPVGAWQQLRSDLDVYHHWRTVVLPSLPIDWHALVVNSSFSNLGVHVLRYWEREQSSDLPPCIPSSADFERDVKFLRKMDQWGAQSVRQAWETLESFHWRMLQVPGSAREFAAESVEDEHGGFPESSAFSLDMPRKASSKRRPKRVLESSSAKSSATSAPAPRKKRSKAAAQEGGDASGAEEEDDDQQELNDSWAGEAAGGGGVRQHWSTQDPQLQEELLGLHAAGSSSEWSAAQVALVLEVVLINFFVRGKREDALPALLKGGGQSSDDPAVTIASDAFFSVGLPTSFLDVRWDETDFALVADSLISAAILSSHIPDQKVARNRIIQCIKYRPALRGMVAWILCNKGSRVSPTFARIISQLGLSAAQREPAEGGDGQQQAHAVFALLAQSYSDGGEQLPPRRAEFDALRRFPFPLVARVTRELFVLGFLRQAHHCGRAKCREGRAVCPHNKRSFELTELYDDAQSGIAGATFFKKWLESGGVKVEGKTAGTDKSQATSWNALLTVAEAERDVPSFRVLCLSHALSLSANAISAALDVQVLDGECGLSEQARASSDMVVLMDPNVCDEHSGFCEKSFNAVSAHMAAAEPAQRVRSQRGGMLADGPPHEGVGVAVPWEVWDGTGEVRQCVTNRALLRLLSAKVLAVLAEKPGASAAAIHTALLVLSAVQVEELLYTLQLGGQVIKRVPAARTHRGGPFAFTAGSERQSVEPVYFVNIPV